MGSSSFSYFYCRGAHIHGVLLYLSVVLYHYIYIHPIHLYKCMIPDKNCPICKFREGEMCKRKRRLISNIEQPTCVHYAPSLYHQFMNFFEHEWRVDKVYETTDFVDKFGITRHLANHYLYKVLVCREHLVFRVKKHNKCRYIKNVDDIIDRVEQYKKDGAKITIDK